MVSGLQRRRGLVGGMTLKGQLWTMLPFANLEFGFPLQYFAHATALYDTTSKPLCRIGKRVHLESSPYSFNQLHCANSTVKLSTDLSYLLNIAYSTNKNEIRKKMVAICCDFSTYVKKITVDCKYQYLSFLFNHQIYYILQVWTRLNSSRLNHIDITRIDLLGIQYYMLQVIEK